MSALTVRPRGSVTRWWWRVPDGEFGLSPDLLDAGRPVRVVHGVGEERERIWPSPRMRRAPLIEPPDPGTDRACPHLLEGEGAKARSCRGTPAYPRARCAPVLPLPTLALRGEHGVLQPKQIVQLVSQCLASIGGSRPRDRRHHAARRDWPAARSRAGTAPRDRATRADSRPATSSATSPGSTSTPPKTRPSTRTSTREYVRKYRGSTSAIARITSPGARATSMRVDPR